MSRAEGSEVEAVRRVPPMPGQEILLRLILGFIGFYWTIILIGFLIAVLVIFGAFAWAAFTT